METRQMLIAVLVTGMVVLAATGTVMLGVNTPVDTTQTTTTSTQTSSTTTETTTTTTHTIIIWLRNNDLVFYNITVPDWEFPMLDGVNLTMSSLRGKVVVLDFFATWCSACATQNRVMVEIYEHYSAEELEVVSITLSVGDTAQMLEDYKEQYGMLWRFGWGTDEVAADYLDIIYIPTLVIIDESGVIRWIHEGTWIVDDMIATIDGIMS